MAIYIWTSEDQASRFDSLNPEKTTDSNGFCLVIDEKHRGECLRLLLPGDAMGGGPDKKAEAKKAAPKKKAKK